MSITSAAALRGYQQNQQIASTSDSLKSGGIQKQGGTDKNVVAEGLEAFSKVFETASVSTEAFARGEVDAQTVVEALATAEVTLEAAVTIRNRVVEAYQELLRMPI